jgi:hypothetical protein
VLTTFDLDEYVYQALRAGASEFVLHLLLKLAARDRAQLVVIAYQSGSPRPERGYDRT